ncbi:Hypothetical predicted protein, partial [Pelobates cultripes]
GAKQNTTKYHIKAPLTALRALSPDIPLQSWLRAGISQVSQLLDNREVIPFPELQTKWNLPPHTVFYQFTTQGAYLLTGTAPTTHIVPRPASKTVSHRQMLVGSYNTEGYISML